MLADLARRDVVAFDLFGDLDLAGRVVTGGSLTELVEAALIEPAGEVVYGASFENHPALVARLAERHTLLGNSPETLRAVRDPERLRAFSAPRMTLTAPSSGRWVSKPLRGGGGIRVRDWSGGAVAEGTYLQERIDGLPCSAAAVGDGRDAVVIGLTEQLVGLPAFGAGGYRWCGNLVTPLPAGLLEQSRDVCARLAEAFGLRGLFGVDFVWDGETAWTLEVNPRPTASLEAIEAGYGIDVFHAHLSGCAGELPRVDATFVRPAGKAVLFATEDVIAGELRGVRDIPHPGERIAAGRPICTLFSTAGDPLADLEEQAARQRADLRTEALT
jgi:predicted ATP-grasp superfamily ATP-dependent carboligase